MKINWKSVIAAIIAILQAINPFINKNKNESNGKLGKGKL